MPHEHFKSREVGKPGIAGTQRIDARLFDGTMRVFLADVLIVPTGLLTVMFLTRRFGPDGYGLFAVAATLVAWIEWGSASLFSRLTVHLVAEADDWKPVAGDLLRWHLAIGSLAMFSLWWLAAPIAALMEAPVLADYLPLFALDIPLFLLAQAHRNILTGVGQFRSRAVASFGRWMSRLVLIVALVEWGLSIQGAIIGCIGASVVELIVCRYYIRPPLFESGSWLTLPFPRSTLPLILSAASVSCFTKLDLLALKMMGGTSAQAGFYAAAQNLSILPGIFAQGYSALLLSTLNRLIGQGNTDQAKETAREAVRIAMALLPLAGLFAGAAPGIVELCFGPAFRPAATLLTILIFGAIAQVMIAVTIAILTAAGELRWTFWLTGPLVPLAVIGYLCLTPRLGFLGPAVVTSSVAFLGSLTCLIAVRHVWDIHLSAAALFRSLVLCGIAYALAGAGPDAGLGLLIKLGALAPALIAIVWIFERCDTGDLARLHRRLSIGLK